MLEVEDDFADDHYDVILNDTRYAILTEPEIAGELIWGYAGARTVMLLNNLFQKAGSQERAYGYLGGEDFGIFLLTPALRDEVASLIGIPEEAPYEVSLKPPNVGLDWPDG